MEKSLSLLTRDFVTRAAGLLRPEWEYGTQGPYHQFNSGGVEIETGEALYGLMRLIKPVHVLETGTHYGVSTIYMARGIEDNGTGGGNVLTYEWDEGNRAKALGLFRAVGLNHRIDSRHNKSMVDICPDNSIDFALLDTEPNIRFDEFAYYWKAVKPGGIIAIHDLHPHLGHTGQTVNGIYDWPYGDFRELIGPFIINHDVQVMSFRTPRGLTIFQKSDQDFSHTALLRGEIGR